MEWVGVKKVPIGEVVLNDDIRGRVNLPHVAELAQSFKDATGGEPGSFPWATQSADGYHIVTGRDRIAALLHMKARSVTLRVGYFSAKELLVAEVHENLHRRQDNRADLLARLVDEIEATIPDNVSGKGPRRPTPRGIARRQAAEATGVSVAAVERADQRVKAREEGAAPERDRNKVATGAEGTYSAPPPPPIETWGHVWEHEPRGMFVHAKQAQEALDLADKHLRAAQAALSGMAEVHLPAGQRDQLRDQVHSAADRVRAARPAAVCPWCKYDLRVGDAYVVNCNGCRGKGWVTAETLKNAPPELKAPDIYAIGGGFFRPLKAAQVKWESCKGEATTSPGESARVSGLASPPSRGRKHITIRLPDGTVADPFADDPPPPTDDDAPVSEDDLPWGDEP